MAMLPTIGAFAQETPVKKVMIEDLTGIKCQFCPGGTVVVDGLKAANPTTAIIVATHAANNPYETSTSTVKTALGNPFDAAFDVSGYPAGAVDRKEYPARSQSPTPWPGIAMGRGDWAGAFNARKAVTAGASVSFSNLKQTSAGVFEGDLNIKFVTAPTAGIKLVANVYVLEDSIPATGVNAQTNYSGGPNGGVSPVPNWFHNRTLRTAASANTWGWDVTTMLPAGVTVPVVGTTYTKHFTFTADPTWVLKDLQLVGYVAYNGTGADQKEVLNSEEASLGGKFVTGINDVKNLEITNVYPNPAMQNDIIRMQYNTTADAKVNMVVMNVAGQVVAHPYASADIAGTHTIQWRAADHNLAPGVYIMQVSTDKGETTTQKINIR